MPVAKSPAMRGCLSVLLGLSLAALLAGCAPQRAARSVAAPRAAPLTVNISQWPEGHSLRPRLRSSAAMLVAYDGATLQELPGCGLAGTFASQPPPPGRAMEAQVIRTQDELDARFPLRDPSIRITQDGARREGLPLVWRWLVREERSLRALADNARPPSAACARATHAVIGVGFGAAVVRRTEPASPSSDGGDAFGDPVGLEILGERCASQAAFAPLAGPASSEAATRCSEPLWLTLAPLGPFEAIQTATFLRVTPPPGEGWLMSVEGDPDEPLPAERWLLPGATATLRRRGDGARLHFTAGSTGGERVMGIAYEPDRAYPWVGLGVSVGGAGLAATGFGLLATGETGSAATSSGGSSDLSGGAGRSLETVAGLTLLGALGTAMTLGGMGYVALGRQPIPVLRASPGASVSGRSASARSSTVPLTLTPTGVDLRF